MKKKKRWKLRLAQKISLLVIVLIIISIGISIFISGNWYLDKMMENIRQNTLNVVKITAMSPIIIEGLKEERKDDAIQQFVESTQNSLNQIDVIVVADKYGVRYGHTKSDRVGKLFSAEDNEDAVLKGETYVSTGPGTLGDSLRAYTPVIDEQGEIMGFVMAGTLLDSIVDAKRYLIMMSLSFIFSGCMVGIGGAAFLSHYIKKSLLNYEPEDIARLYLENQGILSTVHEGVIAINQGEEITLINETAKKYLQINETCIGKKITDVFPLSKLVQVIREKEELLNVPYALGDRLVVSNNIPIIDAKGNLVGGVCSFRDQTEMNKLAEEMTGVKKIVDALRASTHEFKNKLHVILGLIECGHLEQAKNYIGTTNEELQTTISQMLNYIMEPTISALCIGKSQRGLELKIRLELDEDSHFTNRFNFDLNALIVIIGNLLENAMDHLDGIEKEHKIVRLLLNDEEEELVVRVTDNGMGIKEPDRIFKKGYTTKAGNRGYGLFLLKAQVDKYQGEIEVETKTEIGTCFTIRMNKDVTI